MTHEISRRINRIDGTAIPLRGNDIDTDRIMPARFLRAITFEGLEDHLFEDDRRLQSEICNLKSEVELHPFSNPAFREASILIVNRNFGCGSSREHAPQALRRWGIRAVIGESFSEIFFGNAVALGLPCFTASADTIEHLMSLAEADPQYRMRVSVADLTVAIPDGTLRLEMPVAARDAFLEGLWDATGLLLDRGEEVRAVAERLPYIRGF